MGAAAPPIRLKHLALYVPDLQAAEEHYAALFGMTVIGREARVRGEETLGDAWATLPPGRDWADASAAGVTIEMVGLRRDGLIIALFPGKPSGDQIHAVGVVIDDAAIEEIAGRLPPDVFVELRRPGYLEFVDRYGVRWQLSPSAEFRSYGERLGRWLDVG